MLTKQKKGEIRWEASSNFSTVHKIGSLNLCVGVCTSGYNSLGDPVNAPHFISFYFSLNNIFPKLGNLKTIAVKKN